MNTGYDNELTLAVVISTIVFFILAAFCISYFITYKRKRTEHEVEMSEFKKQFEHQLLWSRMEMQEQTFQQIGKELHDNVGQLLSTAKMLMGLAERSMDTPPDTLLTANETLGDAIAQLRALSKSMDKDWLERFDFAENLHTEMARINTGRKAVAVYHQRDEIPLAPEQQIILFRIVQEGVQNAIKHAQPEHITIETFNRDNLLHVIITDDGNGVFATDKGKGMGLANMRHRAALLQGSITWDAVPGKGTGITIVLPYQQTHNI